MSKMMLKMLADMAGVSPEEIANNISAFQHMATEGIETLQRIDSRLAAIEQKLGIDAPVILERLEHGEEIGA
jgi:hypothetical protein